MEIIFFNRRTAKLFLFPHLFKFLGAMAIMKSIFLRRLGKRQRQILVLRPAQVLIFANCAHGPETGSMLELFLRVDTNKQWFTAKELAALLGRTDQFVRDLLENRRILGHALCGRGVSERKSYQIHRRAVELYLLQTANFQPDDYVDSLARLIQCLPRDQRERIRNQI
jgi:hypothetical protein